MIFKDEIIIIDNIIDIEQQFKLIDFFDKNYLTWKYYEKNIAHGNIEDKDGYVFPGYTKDIKNETNTEILEIIKLIEENSCKKANLEFLKNYRYKFNALPSINPYPPEEVLHRQIHTDTDNQHIVLLYYVNTTYGPTKLFRNKLGNTKQLNDIVENQTKCGNFDNVQIIKSVSPKQGRLVIFDGSLLHSPGWPMEGMRYVINYNIVVKTKHKALL